MKAFHAIKIGGHFKHDKKLWVKTESFLARRAAGGSNYPFPSSLRVMPA